MRLLLIGAGLAAVVATAAILRFVALDVNPGGLFVDEAAEALSALRILQDPGYRPVFFSDGGGREALFAYLVAGGFAVFGESVIVLRAVAAAVGVAAVLAVWMLARRFGQVAGLVAAGWAAGSLWLICVSRDGMRNTLVPLFAAAALAALLTWQRRPGRATAVLAGAATALAALYTYQPLKLLPVLVLVWTWWLSRTNRSAFLAMRPTLPLAAASFLVVAAPMVVAAVTDPASYFGRAAGTSLFTDPISELPDHWLRTLGMFTSTGDPNQRHDIGATPLLGWPVFAIATVGLGRLWRQRHEPAQALILWSLPIFLLPPLLATEGGAPHFLRALGLAAPLAATIGIGASATAGWVGERWAGMARAGALAAAAAGLLALAIASGVGYQSRPVADRYDAFDYDLVALADAAGPADIAILDDYSAGVVRFLARPEPPGFVDPGTRLQDVPAGAKVLALTLDDLSAALGEVVTARAARIIAVDPGGRPRVWAVTP